jgi:hypothetical protein
MGRAPSRFVSSTARRALLVAAAGLLTVGVAPAFADGPLGLDAKVDAGGTVSGVTGTVAGAVPPSAGAPAAPASTSAPALAKAATDAAVDTAAAVPAAAHRVTAPPDRGGPPSGLAAGAQRTMENVASGTGDAASPVRNATSPVTDAAAPTVDQAARHVGRVAPAADRVVQGIDRLARQLTPLLQRVTPLLQQVDPLVRGLTGLLPSTGRLLRGPAPGAALVESRLWRLPGLGTADPPAANGEALSGTRDAPRVGAPPHPANGTGPPDLRPRGEAPSSAPAGSTTLAPREALRPPLSRSAPAGAPAGGGSAGFFFSPFLALLVLVALAAPGLLRRFEPPPAFLRPALLACALERPG